MGKIIKLLIRVLGLVVLISVMAVSVACQPIQPVDPAASDESGETMTLTGKAFEYQVADYHLRVTFEAEDRLHWEYLAAPDGLTGKQATETIERTDVRPDVFLLRWLEDDGTQVIDVLDWGLMTMHANFVTADGQRFSAQAPVTLVDEK